MTSCTMTRWSSGTGSARVSTPQYFKMTKIDGDGTVFALKKDYSNLALVEAEHQIYKVIQGNNIGPAFEAFVLTEMCTLNFVGLILQYIETVPADEANKIHAKGAAEALKRMHDLNYIQAIPSILGMSWLAGQISQLSALSISPDRRKPMMREKRKKISRNLKAAFSKVQFDDGYGVIGG